MKATAKPEFSKKWWTSEKPADIKGADLAECQEDIVRRFPTVLLAFLVALVGSVSGARAACVFAGGTRLPAVLGPDFCVSEIAPGVEKYPGIQPDSNGDNFGTRCDGDYGSLAPFVPQDCRADLKRDYPLFVRSFRAGVGADQDHDGNGVVNANDFTLWVQLWSSNATPEH